MSARGVTRFAVWMLLITVLNFALPNQHLFVWTTIGVSSVTAILVGTARNAPRRRAPTSTRSRGKSSRGRATTSARRRPTMRSEFAERPARANGA